LTEGIEVRPELYCQAINLWRFVSNVERDGLSIQPGRDLASLRCTNRQAVCCAHRSFYCPLVRSQTVSLTMWDNRCIPLVQMHRSLAN
jgi:hypothetical protein